MIRIGRRFTFLDVFRLVLYIKISILLIIFGVSVGGVILWFILHFLVRGGIFPL